MKARAFMCTTTDMALPGTYDTFVKGVCVKTNLTLGDILTVGYVDTTKMGVLTQTLIDRIGQWCQDVVARNPLSASHECNFTRMNNQCV